MKKFTLIAAAAAMTVSSAIAATPEKIDAFKPTKSVAEVQTVKGDALRVNDMLLTNSVVATAEGDDQVTIETEVSYVPAANSLYLGFSPAAYGYPYPMGFTGIRNQIGFLNMTQGADAFNWAVGKVTGINDEGTDYNYDFTNYTEQNLFMPLTPMSRYHYPQLSATFGSDEYTYSAHQFSIYHCGGSPLDWGFCVPDNPADVASYVDLFGVSPCAAAPSATMFPLFVMSRPEASNYDSESFNENGASLSWEEGLSDEENVVDNVNITAFGTYIPEMPSPYMMDATWVWVNTVEAKAAVSLPIKVYAIDEEGSVDFNTVLGGGAINFAEGETTISSAGTMSIAELTAYDEDGYEIDSPICVGAGQAIMVCIEGLDNENLLRFDLVLNSSCEYPVEKADLANTLFPNHAFTFMNCTLNGEEQSLMVRSPYRYYTDDTYSALLQCSDICMYFNVTFPNVMNIDATSADYETANFNVEVPTEGGEVVVPVYCDYIIDTLIAEGLVNAVSSEWITFSQAFDQEQGITNVTISAAALPEGETGRTGYVVYEGYALDFHIAVTQGEGAGIDGIEVRPVAKGTKFYDMQGRQLQAAPATGMYIESVDGKATKRLAR